MTKTFTVFSVRGNEDGSEYIGTESEHDSEDLAMQQIERDCGIYTRNQKLYPHLYGDYPRYFVLPTYKA